MNDHLMEIMVRDIVAGLPAKKREVYRYVVRAEQELAKQSETKEQFLKMLTICAPHYQAADQFQITIDDLLKLMLDIEDEITAGLDKRLEKYKWLDYSDSQPANRLQFLCIL
ncbi:hypothetical protein [Metabacillus sp. FJAT-52054]|uniref:Uncharacterized protein n=1 Tax=Metabacillus sediminis TaxID=3117746 RepID=A0ABZ2NE88_9BACI